MMRSFTILAVACLVLLTAGCEGPYRHGWMSVNPNNWANWAERDEPITLDVAGPVSVDVESFGGDVVVEGDPKATQAQIMVVREGTHGYGRRGDAEEAVQDISYAAEIVPGELGQRLQVRATTTNPEPYFLRAHIYITLPDVDGVRVRTANGRVELRNIRGAVDIETSEKDVRVATNQPMNRPVTILNRNGDIEYRVRGESQGKFDAQTVHGSVSGLVRYGRLLINGATKNDTWRATLNGGANPIILRTVNGDISIAVVHNPELVGSHYPE